MLMLRIPFLSTEPTSKNPSQIQSDKQRHRHGLWSKNEYGNNNEDFAIETPVTVIGERSWPNPVEKEISEGSASEQLFEIQKEKARLAAISEPNDEMEVSGS